MFLDMTMNPRNCPFQFPSLDTKGQGTCRARAKRALLMGSPKVAPPWVVPVLLTGFPERSPQKPHKHPSALSQDLGERTQGTLSYHLCIWLQSCASSGALCESGGHLLYILKTQSLAGSLRLGFPQCMMDVSSSAYPFSTG